MKKLKMEMWQLKSSSCDLIKILRKLKNISCNKTKKSCETKKQISQWQSSKTKILTKLKKTQIERKLNSNLDNMQNFKSWQNWKLILRQNIKLKNLSSNKIKNNPIFIKLRNWNCDKTKKSNSYNLKKLKIKIKLSLDKNNMTPQQVKRFALESVLISCKICCNNLVSNKAFFVKCFLKMKQKNMFWQSLGML